MNRYEARDKQHMMSLVEGGERPDIVIINLGMHYNDLYDFEKHLTLLKDDLKGITERRKATNSKFISWHWLETFPQHFQNGYYSPGVKSHKNTIESLKSSTIAINSSLMNCHRIEDMRHYHTNDWRNRLAEDVLSSFKTTERVIKIAEPLYSQWDAHVDYGDSRRDPEHEPDCTHYCTGSGVFRFALTETLMDIAHCLSHHCGELTFD